MSSLKWDWTGATCWHAQSVTGYTWRIKVGEGGAFRLIDNNRLPYTTAPFYMLRSAQSWCEEREVELIAEQPKRRLARLVRRRDGITDWVYDAKCDLMPGTKVIGSAWITEGEFADD